MSMVFVDTQLLRRNATSMRQMLDKARIKELVRGRWPSVLASLGIAVPNNTKRQVPCPVSGGTDRFQFDDQNGDGTWFCRQCVPHAGDGFALIQKVKRCTFLEALQLVSETLGSPSVHQERVLPRPKAAESDYAGVLARRLWSEANPDDGRISRYFLSRGLSGLVPDSLRLHAKLLLKETSHNGAEVKTYLPGIVAQVIGLNGPMPAIHRTYLDANGNGKAKVNDAKKTLGSYMGGAIHLSTYLQGEPLVLCEGIETALAIQESKGYQTWACISAGGLEAVRVPIDCGAIYIAADLDRNARGQEAAQKLAARLHAEGKTNITILVPPGPIPGNCKGLDWLDVLNGAHNMEGVYCS